MTGEDDSDVLECERLTDGRDNVGEHCVKLQRACERPAEPCDRGVRIDTFPVHQPVDEALHTGTQRLEANGHDARHDERDDEVAAG